MVLLALLVSLLAFSTANIVSANEPQNPLQAAPAPLLRSDDSRIAATPVPRIQRYAVAKPATHTAPPFAGPELNHLLRRQQADDPLGWKNTRTCNVGVCDTGLTCSVWNGNGALTNPATGICCPTTTVCPDYTTCQPWGSHSVPVSKFTGAQAYLIYSASTLFCGSLYPLCYTGTIDYAYGLGRMAFTRCASELPAQTVSTNGNWQLYAAKSIFEADDKGPKPVAVSRSTSLPIPTPTTSVRTSSGICVGCNPEPTDVPTGGDGGSDTLGAGAIAGIVIGGVAALGISAVIAVWLILRHKRKSKAAGAGDPFNPPPVAPGTDAGTYWDGPPPMAAAGTSGFYAPGTASNPTKPHAWNQSTSTGAGYPNSPGMYGRPQISEADSYSIPPQHSGGYQPPPLQPYEPVEVPGSMPEGVNPDQGTLYPPPPPPPQPPSMVPGNQGQYGGYNG